MFWKVIFWKEFLLNGKKIRNKKGEIMKCARCGKEFISLETHEQDYDMYEICDECADHEITEIYKTEAEYTILDNWQERYY